MISPLSLRSRVQRPSTSTVCLSRVTRLSSPIQVPSRRVAALARALGDRHLLSLVAADVAWDVVESVEPAGAEHQLLDTLLDCSLSREWIANLGRRDSRAGRGNKTVDGSVPTAERRACIPQRARRTGWLPRH